MLILYLAAKLFYLFSYCGYGLFNYILLWFGNYCTGWSCVIVNVISNKEIRYIDKIRIDFMFKIFSKSGFIIMKTLTINYQNRIINYDDLCQY